MGESKDKKNSAETPPDEKEKVARPYYRKRRRVFFTPRLKQVIDMLQEAFPKVFTRRPAPKYALKIGIFVDLLPWAEKNSVSKVELGKALSCWCRGSRYVAALDTGKRYDLDFNETPFYVNSNKKEETPPPQETTAKTSSKRKRITFPENWSEVYPRWKNKEITAKAAMELLGLKQSTFYRLSKEYAEKSI